MIISSQQLYEHGVIWRLLTTTRASVAATEFGIEIARPQAAIRTEICLIFSQLSSEYKCVVATLVPCLGWKLDRAQGRDVQRRT
ncbi:hypothetical protein D3C76_1703950 [compost metagenome]